VRSGTDSGGTWKIVSPGMPTISRLVAIKPSWGQSASRACASVAMGSTGCSQSGRPPLAHPARSRRACLRGYLPFYRLIVNPQTTCGLTANNRVEPRGGDEFTVRFTDGTYSLEAGGSGPVDCTITADLVAFLFVVSGRLPAAAAIALGMWRLSGNRPELALGFTDLFVYP
jgi:SCP-2 sterol transfer family